MAKKLVLEVKISTENLNVIICDDGTAVWDADYCEAFPQFPSLKKMLLKGFTIRIDEIDSEYNLIIHKKMHSTSFNVPKEKGVINVLAQTEDWAQTFLEELEQDANI